MRIMKTSGLAGLCLFLLLSFAGSVSAAPQTECPVMGGKINKKIYADYQGQRVYFCCEACKPKFNEDPEKYLAKMKEMGQEPEKTEEAAEEATAEPDKEGASGHEDHHRGPEGAE